MNFIIVFIAQYLYLVVLAIAGIFFLTRPRAVKKSMAILGVIIAPLAYVISRIVSHFYYDPRPFVVGRFAPLFAHVADNGFPSDHVLLMGAMAMIIWFYNKKLSVVLWVLALVTGWARVWSGVHHATDIIGSVVIVVAASAVYFLLPRTLTSR